MDSKQLIILGAVGLLLLSRQNNAAAAPVAPVSTGAVNPRAPSRAYFDPVALAAQYANSVLASWGKVAPKALPEATANPESARAAVRAFDPYYGAGALAWTAGNTEEARSAVRVGDAYYTSRPEQLEQLWSADVVEGLF